MMGPLRMGVYPKGKNEKEKGVSQRRRKHPALQDFRVPTKKKKKGINQRMLA